MLRFADFARPWQNGFTRQLIVSSIRPDETLQPEEKPIQ